VIESHIFDDHKSNLAKDYSRNVIKTNELTKQAEFESTNETKKQVSK
jgi:hypothetical protein